MRAVLPMLVGGGLLLGLLLSRPAAPEKHGTTKQRWKMDELARRVVEYVAVGESNGKWWAQNRNTDNAGLSYGIVQWTQSGGGLGKLLAAMYQKDAAMFQNIFGAPYKELLSVTAAKSAEERLKPVGGVLLWTSPWTERFTLAGHHPPFQEAQLETAIRGQWWKEALKVGILLGVHSERAYILYFNRTNHQGYRATEIARSLVTHYNSAGWPDASTILVEYSAWCAAYYRRDSRPTEGDWRYDVNRKAWFRYAGVNLFDNIVERTSKILADTTLEDDELELLT